MQSQFSVLYNESLQLKAHLDEARTLLHGTRATHQRQVELIEVRPVLISLGALSCHHHHCCVCVALPVLRIFMFLTRIQALLVPNIDEVKDLAGLKHQVLFPCSSSEG